MNAKVHRSPMEALDTQAFMERDMSEQISWLAHAAEADGYADLNDLFSRAPAAYTRLAATWRQTHPFPAMA